MFILFVYAAILLLYLALMAAGLSVCLVLYALEPTRRLAWPLALAVICTLPGIFVFQVFAGLASGALFAAVLWFYELASPPDWIRWLVGIPSMLLAAGVFTAASFAGCLVGAYAGWTFGGGAPLREMTAHLKESAMAIMRNRRKLP